MMFTAKYSVKPQATKACIKPIIGRVLNSDFWLRKAPRPTCHFLKIFHQFSFLAPKSIILNILLKDMYEIPKEVKESRINANFSDGESNILSFYKYSIIFKNYSA